MIRRLIIFLCPAESRSNRLLENSLPLLENGRKRSFSSSVVTLNGFGDDGAGGVASLVILALRGDGPGEVTGAQTPGYRQTTEESGHCRCHDLVNFLFVHVFSFR